MKRCLQLFGTAAVWSEIIATLNDLPDADRELGEKLADAVIRECAAGIRNIDLPDGDDDFARWLALYLSQRVSTVTIRLSEMDEAADVETVSLYHAGQRLATRAVAWPRRLGDEPKVELTETEFRFSLRVVTDLPTRLDAIINDLSVHQESLPQERPVFPIALAIPEAENSWGRLPGFRAVFSAMFGDNGKGNALENSLACIRMPEPQSLVYLEAVRHPAATVFDFEFLVFGLPAQVVCDLFRARLANWARVYLQANDKGAGKGSRYFLASLTLPLRAGMSRDEAWHRLYALAGQTDGMLNWSGDTNDPHGWADQPDCRFASAVEGFGHAAELLVISRRVPLPDVNLEATLIDSIRPALHCLPAEVCLEIAHAGAMPWFKRMSGGTEVIGTAA